MDDPTRFRRSRDVAAYFGLRSRRRQSGTSIDVQGRISKAGDVDVRRALYEAASDDALQGQGQGQELGPGLAKRSCTARPPGQEPELSNRLIDVHKTAYASFGESLARNTW